MEPLTDYMQNALSERDLKAKLLQALYVHDGSADVIQLCADNNIAFKSVSQRSRVLESLKESGLIKGVFFINGGGFISITSAGAEYVEGLKNTPQDVPFEPIKQESSTKPSYIFFAKSQKRDFAIKTFDETPCFDVEKLSGIFAEHIHSISNESSQMIGIFGKWGRGKTYFWQQTKKQLNTKYPEKHIFVEFNAWKYHETPAIWAYLYKTFLKAIFGTGWWSRVKITWWNISKNWLTALWHFSIIAIFVLSLLGIIFKENTFVIKNVRIFAWIVGMVSFASFLIKQIRDNNVFGSIDKIHSILRGKDHSKYLGCQAELEGDLESLICYHISSKSDKRIILFIDDIDRCDDNKMLSVVDSLRTILENKEICKRLIIVCAVDGERLKSAISTKYEGGGILDTQDKKTAASQLAREQIDKLFISGIKLFKLSHEEKVEYLVSLFGNQMTPEFKSKITSTFTPSNENDEKGQSEEADVLDNSKALESFSNAMNKGILDDATPRQLKITYYRYLLANNILGGAPVQHDMLIKAIYEGTCGECEDYSEFDAEFNKVLNTVVCY